MGGGSGGTPILFSKSARLARLRVYTGAEIVDRAYFSDARGVHHARLTPKPPTMMKVASEGGLVFIPPPPIQETLFDGIQIFFD